MKKVHILTLVLFFALSGISTAISAPSQGELTFFPADTEKAASSGSGDLLSQPTFMIQVRGGFGYTANSELNDYVKGYAPDAALAMNSFTGTTAWGSEETVGNTTMLGGELGLRFFFSNLGIGLSGGYYTSTATESKVTSDIYSDTTNIKLTFIYVPVTLDLLYRVSITSRLGITAGAGISYGIGQLNYKWEDKVNFSTTYGESINETYASAGLSYRVTAEVHYRMDNDWLLAGGIMRTFGSLSDFEKDSKVFKNKSGEAMNISLSGWYIYFQASYLVF